MNDVRVPTVLYHYTGLEGLLGILDKNEIWTSNIHYLNDSKEFNLAIECAKQTLSSEIDKAGVVASKDSLIKGVSDKFEQFENLSIHVASFSEEEDLLSQWRSYCPSGAGYAVGFDHGRLGSIAKRKKYNLRPCAYTHVEHTALIQPIISRFIHATIKLNKEQIEQKDPSLDKALRNLIADFIQVAPMIKHSSFKEEREWRLISDPFPTNHPMWSVRPGKSMLIPYSPFQLDDAICKIVVGPTSNQYLASSSVASALNKYGIKGWSVSLSNSSYHDW